MQKSARKVLVVAFCLLIVALLLHIGIGSSVWYSPLETASQIFRGSHRADTNNFIIWGVRLPRALSAAVVGAILGVAGSALQTLFRNQLAEPYIVGSSSGAAVGAATIFVIGSKFQWSDRFGEIFVILAKPIAGFVTGLLTLIVVMALAKRRGVIETPTLLLAGVVVATMLSSLLSLIILSSGMDQRVVLSWMLGSFDVTFWPQVLVLVIVFAVCYLILFKSSQRMNAMSLGEEGAQALGVSPVRIRRTVLICVTAMTSVTVGAVGIIGFVGLVAPHISRRLVGSDLRATLPLSAVFGSLLMLFADAIAQRGMQGAGFPVGIVTAIIGAPVLLVLLKRR
jgi:iron complex transport system permease protein